MPTRGVVRRDRKNHSNLRPKHKHTKNYLQHYWPYLPMLVMLLIGLWFVKPLIIKPQNNGVLAYATNVNSQTLLSETNKAREQNGKSDLKINSELTAAAQAKAQDMVAKNYWSHNTPDGSPPWVFITATGYQYQKAGENLAYGFTSSKDTITGWMNSPTHRANLLDSDFIDVGFGTATSPNFNNSGPVTIVVAMYARSINEQPFIQVISDNNSPSTYNSQQKTTTPTQAKQIKRVDLLSGSRLPWVSSILSFIMGAAIAVFVLKHMLVVKRTIRKGEKFVVTHPMLDVILVSVVLLCVIATSTIGNIL